VRQQRADLLAGVAGVVLLISMFLPWFGPSADTERAIQEADEISKQFNGGPLEALDLTENAWQTFTIVDLILAVTALAGVRAGVAALARRTSGRATVGATAVTAALGAISTLLILYRVINPIGEAGREYGLFIGFFAALGVAAGGWLALEQGVAPRSGARPDSIGSSADA
jgi:hypothetical protein